MEERGIKIFAPDEEEPTKDSDVFFNDKMKANRDLSEIALKTFREETDIDDFRAVDALAASGIRGMRFSKHVDRLFLNDANPSAVQSIKKGLEENSIEAEVSERDANVLLSEHSNFFHFIDVDPFGPFTNYLDSAARASNHESFVGFTATDNAAPAGSYPTVCERRYASKPLKNSFMHETGLRIYIKEVFENYARFDKAFEPKISFHERHYSRVMGRVTDSKKRANQNLDNIGHLSFCPDCRWRALEEKDRCPVCGSKTNKAGPLWIGKLSDSRFTEKMIENMPDWDSREFLELIDAESEILTPFYDIHELASVEGIPAPPRDTFLERLEEKGYPVARTHFTPQGFRTDAPIEDIKKVLRNVSEQGQD